MTLSLLARCPDTGQFGMVIASSSPAVAARCAHARAGVGVAASQNITDPALGPALLDHLASGATAAQAMAATIATAPHITYRQLMLVDADGGTAFHCGARMLGIWAVAEGSGCIAGGNLLANDRVAHAMVTAFSRAAAPFGDRLIAALRAGLDAGGEAGQLHSAGLTIVDKLTWPLVDLRCDWTDDCPTKALVTAWGVYQPQMQAYVDRAQNPGLAPSYGVPGDP